MTGTLADAAIDLYRMTGQGIIEPEERELRAMLAQDTTGQWAERTYHVQEPGPTLLYARALAGLFLLDEDVVWSAARAAAVREAFGRTCSLVEAIPSAMAEVRQFRRANGAQGIELVSGKRLRFVSGLNGARGLSSDCRIVEATLADGSRDRLAVGYWSGAGRPNPQVVASVWSSA